MAVSADPSWMHALSQRAADLEAELEYGVHEGDKCTLLSGSFDAIVQVVLAMGAFGSLLVKRHLETPKRTLQVWSLDTAKQGMSAGAAHVSGMLVAMVASHDGGDQCAFYLITFTIDTTLGVFIGYVLLKRLQALARSRGWDSLSSTGNYGTPVRYSVWAKQMVTWCLIVVIARACCGAIVYSLRHPLASFSEWLAAPFDGHPHLFLLVVMLACPVCMNVAQLWVQDTFLKKGGLLSRRRLRGGGDGGSYEVETEEIDPNAQAAGAMPSASASAGSAARIDVETAPLLAPAASTPRGDAAASSDAEMNAE